MCRVASFAFMLVACLAGGTGSSFGQEKASTEAVTACRAQPDAECLLDIGVALRLKAGTGNSDSRLVAQLIASDRGVDAEAIAQSRASGTMQDHAGTIGVEWALTRHRLADSLRSGEKLDDALRDMPSTSPFVLHLTALTLLGHSVDGPPYRRKPPAPGPRERALAAQIAERIVADAATSTGGMRDDLLVMATELYSELGDEAAARATMQKMSADGAETVSFAEGVFRVVGAEATLETLRRLGRLTPHALLLATTAVGSSERQEGLISEAFEIAAAQRPWPDFDAMREAVERSAKQGRMVVAADLARRLDRLAAATHYPFEVFANLDAAQALADIDSSESDVRDTLDRVEHLFPSDPSAIVAVGLMNGPMRWQQSGLEEEARVKFAAVSAQVGDLDRAGRMLTGLRDPVAWLDLPFSHYAPATADALLAIARNQLAPADYAYVASQAAQSASWSDESSDRRAWALRVARDLFDSAVIDGPHAQQVFTTIAVVAWKTDDRGLKIAALNRLGKYALSNGTPADIVAAGAAFKAMN